MSNPIFIPNSKRKKRTSAVAVSNKHIKFDNKEKEFLKDDPMPEKVNEEEGFINIPPGHKEEEVDEFNVNPPIDVNAPVEPLDNNGPEEPRDVEMPPPDEPLDGPANDDKGVPEKEVEIEGGNQPADLPEENQPHGIAGEDQNGPELEESFTDYYLDCGYCSRNNGKEEYYGKDEKGNQIYWTDDAEEQVYAWKTMTVNGIEQRIEYPVAKKDGTLEFIYDLGIPRYPENKDTSEIVLPIDPVTKEEMYIPNLDGNINYPKNKYGKEFYRRDARGDQVPLTPHVYAKNENGDEIYPKLSNGDEFYLREEGSKREMGAAKMLFDKQIHFYARKANGDEFYPRVWM